VTRPAEGASPPEPDGPAPPTRGPDGLDPATGREVAPPEADGDDLAVVRAELSRAEPSRLTVAGRAVRLLVDGVAVAAGATALLAGALVTWAWGTGPAPLAVAVGFAVLGVGAPAFVAVRSHRLVAALAHPEEVLAQARDLVVQAKGSPELGRLAARLRGRGAGRAAASARRFGRLGRVRRVVASGRLLSAVIGLAGPDPDRHPHLVAFTPTRLRSLWLAVTLTWWTWVAAGATSAVALIVVVVGAVS